MGLTSSKPSQNCPTASLEGSLHGAARNGSTLGARRVSGLGQQHAEPRAASAKSQGRLGSARRPVTMRALWSLAGGMPESGIYSDIV